MNNTAPVIWQSVTPLCRSTAQDGASKVLEQLVPSMAGPLTSLVQVNPSGGGGTTVLQAQCAEALASHLKPAVAQPLKLHQVTPSLLINSYNSYLTKFWSHIGPSEWILRRPKILPILGDAKPTKTEDAPCNLAFGPKATWKLAKASAALNAIAFV